MVGPNASCTIYIAYPHTHICSFALQLITYPCIFRATWLILLRASLGSIITSLLALSSGSSSDSVSVDQLVSCSICIPDRFLRYLSFPSFVVLLHSIWLNSPRIAVHCARPVHTLLFSWNISCHQRHPGSFFYPPCGCPDKIFPVDLTCTLFLRRHYRSVPSACSVGFTWLFVVY